MIRRVAPLFVFALCLFLSAHLDAQKLPPNQKRYPPSPMPGQPAPVLNYTCTAYIKGTKPSGTINGYPAFKRYSNVQAVGALYLNGVPDFTASMFVLWKFPTVVSSSSPVGRYVAVHPPPHISWGASDPTTIDADVSFIKNGQVVKTITVKFVRDNKQ